MMFRQIPVALRKLRLRPRQAIGVIVGVLRTAGPQVGVGSCSQSLGLVPVVPSDAALARHNQF